MLLQNFFMKLYIYVIIKNISCFVRLFFIAGKYIIIRNYSMILLIARINLYVNFIFCDYNILIPIILIKNVYNYIRDIKIEL